MQFTIPLADPCTAESVGQAVLRSHLLPVGCEPGLQSHAAILQLSGIRQQLLGSCLPRFLGSCLSSLQGLLPLHTPLLCILHLTIPILPYHRQIKACQQSELITQVP